METKRIEQLFPAGLSVIKDAQGGVWMSPMLDQDPASGAHVPSAGTAQTLPEDWTPENVLRQQGCLHG